MNSVIISIIESTKIRKIQFISEKRFNPDKVSKTHNLSVECEVFSWTTFH